MRTVVVQGALAQCGVGNDLLGMELAGRHTMIDSAGSRKADH